MQFLIDYGLWSIPLLWILHEGGHWIACKAVCGKNLKFKWGLEFGIIPIGAWDMPLGLTEKQHNSIYFWGFGLEFLPWLCMPLVYMILSVLHFVTYFIRWDNGESRYWKRVLGGK